MSDVGATGGTNRLPYAIEKLMSFKERVKTGELGECISTGIPKLDEFLGGGLMPYLYVLIATPGVGKTTLVQQMIEAIARSGRVVISVDLDMSEELLFAKALSRQSYERYGPERALTMREVMRLGEHPSGEHVLDELCESYAKTAETLVMVRREDLAHQKSLEDIVESFCEEGKPKPVVCVDYLQYWATMHQEENDKRAVEKVVDEMKALSQRLKLPVVLISSVNRNSYNKNKLTLASAKESGNIEYAADVVLGLEKAEDDADVGENAHKVNFKLLKTRFDDYKTMELIMNGAYNIFYDEEKPRPKARII